MINSLQKMCIDTITRQTDLYTELPSHLADDIYREKHRQLMSKTFGYLKRINDQINNGAHQPDISICNIKYLVGHDFFSYDHLLVRYKFKNICTFSFIQI
jgi:hypothetical protein